MVPAGTLVMFTANVVPWYALVLLSLYVPGMVTVTVLAAVVRVLPALSVSVSYTLNVPFLVYFLVQVVEVAPSVLLVPSPQNTFRTICASGVTLSA
ncbi:hypothetical protein Acsp01_37500 [Actinoplanes sp. NBRC 101535]|nr:hypothetical protein Acsp01_37500 [Actinoplanes sp. NBRC 101535]